MDTMFPVVMLLAAWVGFSRAEEASQNVRYEGPVVYSNLPPPVLYFPTVPPPDRSLRQSNLQSRMHQAGITKSAIEYVPFPYQDLPVLVYQSKENPPIHVVNDLQDGEKSSGSYNKNIDSTESPPNINTVVNSDGYKGVENNYYQQGVGTTGISLNNGLEYQHVYIHLPQDVQSNPYGTLTDNEQKHYSDISYYQNEYRQHPQSSQYYPTPYTHELDMKKEYEKLSRQTYGMEQQPDNVPQSNEAYQTVALIDYSHLMPSNPDHDTSEERTGKSRDSSPERIGYLWRQSTHPRLRQYLHSAGSVSESQQIPIPTASGTRYYHPLVPVNPFAAFYDLSTRFLNIQNQNEPKPGSAYSVSASGLQHLYAAPTQGVHENMAKNYRINTADTSNAVYQTSPSSIQQLFVQMPQELDKGNRETKHVDNAASSSQTSHKQNNNQNYLHHSNMSPEALNNHKNSEKSTYQAVSGQSSLKPSDGNADTSGLPHVVYTGHPPIHVFQHPIVIKVGSEKHSKNTQENQFRIPIGSLGNFGALRPTFHKGSLDSSNHFEQASSNADTGTQSPGHSEGAKNSGNLAEIFRQQAEAYLGSQSYGTAEQGHVQAIALPIGFDSIAIYGSKFGPLGGVNKGYYNRYFIPNKTPSTGQGTNAAVLASRLFGRLAALGNTLFVNNLGLKPQYYHNLVSPQSYGTLTELINTQPVHKLEGVHYANPSNNRDSNLNSKLSQRMSGTQASHTRDSDSTLKVQYKTPPTKATAAPQHNKPPIIIYKGIQPPVHIYGNEKSIEKGNSEDQNRGSYADTHSSVSGQLNLNDYERANGQQGLLPVTATHGITTPHSSQPTYHVESYAASVPQTYSVPYDYSASTFSNRASVDHEDFDNAEQTYHPALDYPKERSDASWMPINFPHYTEAESISDIIVPAQQPLENQQEQTGVEKESQQLDIQGGTLDTLQPRADEEQSAEVESAEMKN